MSKMPEYDATAGFPRIHVDAFKNVACRNKMVISSRELNPLCTDLVLEGYAAKGFHIKAKTCDWGPMAGFVPEDYRFTKGSQNPASQKRDIDKAFEHHAMCVPLFISPERFQKLELRGLLNVTNRKDRVCEVSATPEGTGTTYRFTLVKLMAPPPGFDSMMWAVNYHPNQASESSALRHVAPGDFPTWPGLRPVFGMANPHSPAALGAKAAVAGDYDLWCIFPHSSLGGSGVSDRLMPLRATQVKFRPGATMQKLTDQYGDPGESQPRSVSSSVAQAAARAKLVFASDKDKNDLATAKEDQHLGNISLAVLKIRAGLNQACASPGGNLVQHSDYGGNPFGTIDYPLIFFVPDPVQHFSQAEVLVARNISELQGVLRHLLRLDYVLKLNPAWSVPLY